MHRVDIMVDKQQSQTHGNCFIIIPHHKCDVFTPPLCNFHLEWVVAHFWPGPSHPYPQTSLLPALIGCGRVVGTFERAQLWPRCPECSGSGPWLVGDLNFNRGMMHQPTVPPWHCLGLSAMLRSSSRGHGRTAQSRKEEKEVSS